MLFRPFLLLFRKRLIATAILSLVVAILAAVLSGHVGRVVPINFFPCILIGGCLGWTSAKNRAAETRFLFTRPIPRLAVLLRPLIVASFAIAVFPFATFLLQLGCLRLLPHARSQLVGPHPSPLDMLGTFAFAYLAGVSVGLIAYALMASQRWLALSPKWLRSLMGFSALFFVLAVVFLGVRRPGLAGFGAIVGALAYWPIIFAAEVLYCCWRILRVIDEIPDRESSSAAMRIEETIRAMQAARAAK